MENRTWHIDLEVRTAEHKLFEDENGNKATEFQFKWFARDFDHLEHLMKQLIKNLNLLAKQLGFGSVVSYDKLYKTAINTFGRKNASMWFFSISLNDAEQIVGIEVHTTYFAHTPQTIAINKAATFDTPITFEQAFKIIKNEI